MEYSIFEKIAYLLDNFESVDRIYINFSREEIIHHVKEYFQNDKIDINFSFKE